METHNFCCKNNACKLINKPLPQEANNQPLLYLRWVVNSDARTSGESGGVGSAGSSRIKDVRIAGERMDGSGHTPRLVNMTFNGDPKTSIALAWYTDQMTDTVLQVVEASKMQEGEFPAHEALVFHGSAEAIKTFMSAKDRDKQKYTTFISHRASVDNLKPGTAYKYRVGNGDDAGWSRIGSFTTDAADNQPYHSSSGRIPRPRSCLPSRSGRIRSAKRLIRSAIRSS
ncbi:fibronectin type III domain-containing protein [Paenibacillus thiaminolyticus]|uniref:fibronectin type III domain-containing protein n=1 Tax=Paenibacillus thiaminolyticus TaxID=49283 RepID=UPI0035A5B5B5